MGYKPSKAKQAQEVRLLLESELYKRSFYDFVQAAAQELEPGTKFIWNWHIKFLCDILGEEGLRVKNREEKNKDYLINIPFRSMKSMLTSILYPAWLWAIDPTIKIMTIAYSEGLAVKQSYLTKILLRSKWYTSRFKNVTIQRDDNSKGAYTNTDGGTRQSFGLEGQITGSGADVIIVDDPHKVSSSNKQMENSIIAYNEMVYNRLNDPATGFRVIVGQRLSDNDLFAELLQNDELYTHINIPAEVTENIKPPELALNYINNLFWEDRFTKKILNNYMVSLGMRSYSAQLNQETISSGGNILKSHWFNIVNIQQSELKNKPTIDLFIDSAYTAKTTNDPTAVLACYVEDNELFIVDVITFHLEFPEAIKEIQKVSDKYCNNLSRIYIEGKASGKSIIQQLKRTSTLSVIELSVKDDKVTRANSISANVEAGRVNLLKDTRWNDAFLDEVTRFPLAKHDDMVDCLIYAVDKLINSNIYFNYGL